MKALALLGSPRRNGNKDIMAEEVLRGCREAGNVNNFVSIWLERNDTMSRDRLGTSLADAMATGSGEFLRPGTKCDGRNGKRKEGTRDR